MNTPPFHATDTAICNFGIANPLTNFRGMQPIRDNQVVFENSLFGFEQWLKPTARIRTRVCPHRFLLAFPGVLDDITLTDAGLLRQSKSDYWTTPAPYSPVLVEHDMVMRESTGQRFQITGHTPIYIEDILVSQHADLAELDPRSSCYGIPIITS